MPVAISGFGKLLCEHALVGDMVTMTFTVTFTDESPYPFETLGEKRKRFGMEWTVGQS